MEYVEMLKTIIRTSGWTQEQLAEQLGVSFATVNSWLNGKSVPREAKLGRIQQLYLAKESASTAHLQIINTGGALAVGEEIVLSKEGYTAKARIVFVHDDLAVAEIMK